MELLRVAAISGRNMVSKRILGTVCGVYERNFRSLGQAVENLFKSSLGNSAELLDLTAAQLLQKMNPTISTMVR